MYPTIYSKVVVLHITQIKYHQYILLLSSSFPFLSFSITPLTVVAVVVMTLGAVLASANDLEFNMVGYFWMAANCFFTSSYTLYMRHASTTIKLSRSV